MSEEKLTWWLDDPRPRAEEAPYTFFLPPPEKVQALAPRDLVKLIFVGGGEHAYDAERMWVEVKSTENGVFIGTLDNEPSDMPQLKIGDEVRFEAFHIIDVEFSDLEKGGKASAVQRREYWDRCLVDQCVLDGEKRVEFIYREKPDMGSDDDKFPDSGWRIRGDRRGCTDEEMDSREAAYVALGAVLNLDDSWLHLIDENWPCRFMRNWATGEYVHD